ncbi:MAG: molybdopterin-dependent oxidoreductase [Spirochaetaceae bacterium]
MQIEYPLEIQMKINGKEQKIKLEGETKLLDLLRDHFGLTGAKNGCGKGVCGTCTVIMNGNAVRSCRIGAAKADGAVIETIENLALFDEDSGIVEAEGDTYKPKSAVRALHPLQFAFIVEGALQCGYCTPGMIMASKALLDQNPSPCEKEIRKALQGNLCRCTGYQSIRKAVHRAADLLREGNTHIFLDDPREINSKKSYGMYIPFRKVSKNGSVIGQEIRDAKILDKVTGRMYYAADLPPRPETLYGRMVYSTYPSAKFSIDKTKAEIMPGVELILTADDIPGKNVLGMLMEDQPALAAGKVISIADPIAAVFASNPATAEIAASALEVHYTEEPGLFTPQEALDNQAPHIHEGGNICHQAHIYRGDVEGAFETAAAVSEGTFYTPAVDPGFMEPESGIAYVDEKGRIVIEMGTQSAFDDRRQLAVALALPEEQIIVKQLPMGGAFGAKEDITLQFALALAALKTGKHIRMSLSREQSFRVHPKRHPVYAKYRMAADSDGSLLAVQADIVADTGAYASLGPDILENMLTFGAGPYEVPNIDIKGRLVYTNNPPSGAMRGFGVPQVAFMVEQLVDRLAEKLDKDPLEMRIHNALVPGHYLASGHRMEEGTAGRDTLETLQATMGASAKPADTEEWSYGIGYATAMKNVGFGHGIDEEAGASLHICEDTIRMYCGTFEYGQGSLTALVQLAAEVLGVPFEAIELDFTETENSPETGATTASRQTFLTGNAVVRAAEKLREKIVFQACKVYGGEKREWIIRSSLLVNTDTKEEHQLFSSTFKGLVASYRYKAPKTDGFKDTPVPFRGGEADTGSEKMDLLSMRTHWSYAYTAQSALVRVHRKTGKIEVLKIWAAQDCGRALNPLNVRSQIEGGVIQGMGYALSEEVVYEQGKQKTDNFDTYRMPRSMQVPDLVPIIVEVPDPKGPFGAKGMGEVPLLATAPAVANAVYDATGTRYNRLPLEK